MSYMSTDHLIEELDKANAKIERLCEESASLRNTLEAKDPQMFKSWQRDDEEMARLLARVEELESLYEDAKLLLDKASGEWFRAHRVTYEMIDAAAGLIEGLPDNHAAWLAFAKLNIRRCIPCEGDGTIPVVVGVMDVDERTCSRCNGHGWTIGGEDE